MKACHACGADIGNPERIGRRDSCLRCGADLHSCLNCRFYSPGHHNDCFETQAEPVADKARGNFCDYFAFREGARAAHGRAGNTRAQLDALFGKKRQ